MDFKKGYMTHAGWTHAPLQTLRLPSEEAVQEELCRHHPRHFLTPATAHTVQVGSSNCVVA